MDPDPEPYRIRMVLGLPDPEVIILYGSVSGSGSFQQQAKKVRKTLISTILWLLFEILSIETDAHVPSKCNKQKNCLKKPIFCWHLGTADPDSDPYQNVTDPSTALLFIVLLLINNNPWPISSLAHTTELCCYSPAEIPDLGHGCQSSTSPSDGPLAL